MKKKLRKLIEDLDDIEVEIACSMDKLMSVKLELEKMSELDYASENRGKDEDNEIETIDDETEQDELSHEEDENDEEFESDDEEDELTIETDE